MMALGVKASSAVFVATCGSIWHGMLAYGSIWHGMLTAAFSGRGAK
jgi:hypothetical protein